MALSESEAFNRAMELALEKYRERFEIEDKLTVKKANRLDRRFSLYRVPKGGQPIHVTDFGAATYVEECQCPDGSNKCKKNRKQHTFTALDAYARGDIKAYEDKSRVYRTAAREKLSSDGKPSYLKKYSPTSLNYWLLY